MLKALVALILWAPTVARSFSGVVEGFYWTSAHAVRGHFGAYSTDQRLQALEFLAASHLGDYVYAPQSVDLLAPFSALEQQDWARTFATAQTLGIRLTYGIRPMSLDDAAADKVRAKVSELASLGCSAYALCFDDVPGGATAAQVALQVALASSLQQAHPALELAFLPGSYYGTRADQEKALAQLDAGLDAKVPMFLAGTAVVPGSVRLTDFPTLPSGRGIVVYDNWAAVDTNTRLPWSLGRGDGLPAELFEDGDAWGYVLNLCFPLERCIHQIARVDQLRANPLGAPAPSSTSAIHPAASTWAAWLVANGFASAEAENAIQADLEDAIAEDKYFASMDELETAHTSLRGVFTSDGWGAPRVLAGATSAELSEIVAV